MICPRPVPRQGGSARRLPATVEPGSSQPAEWTAPIFPETVYVESGRSGRPYPLAIIRLFQLRWQHVADRFQQPMVIEPIDPFQGGVLDRVEMPPRPSPVNHFRFV